MSQSASLRSCSGDLRLVESDRETERERESERERERGRGRLERAREADRKGTRDPSLFQIGNADPRRTNFPLVRFLFLFR